MPPLNPAQQQAVEHIEGPVVVIAGPGTGKTQMLAARVCRILEQTDAGPQSILCLTFTDAGVSAMRQRLLGMIGPEAHRVGIYTFHAFCNRVIQENIEYFGRTGLEPLSDLERIDIVRHLLAQLPPDHPLRSGLKDLYRYETHLRELFATMKKEGWTPGHVHRQTDAYLAELPTRPGFFYKTNSKHGRKGDPKTVLVEAENERMARLKAAADLYPAYQRALDKAGRYEYEDMILWVIRAFERHEALLRTYQERYLYFLVDEFQDTGGAQNRLLQLLLDYWDSPNVFIVGDDDQSIYEFQGARLRNLLDFYETHRDTVRTFVLEENYRSAQALLDTAHRVIDHNLLRAVHTLKTPVSKKLRAQPDTPHAEPRLQVYPNRLQETVGVARQIRALLDAGTPPEQIAVLYARHRQGERLMALLEKTGIPYETRRPVNLLELPWLDALRQLLRYLHDELRAPFGGEARLFKLLHAPHFGLSPLSLSALAAALLPAEAGAAKRPLRAALHDRALLASLQLPDQARFEALAMHLEGWLQQAVHAPLPELIERLYNQSGLLTYALRQPDKVWRLEALASFLDFVSREAARRRHFNLDRLLALLDSMDDNRVPLELQQHIRGGAGVQLLTAHGSKGLEFDHVFLLDCTQDPWEPNARGNGFRFTLPDTLTRSGEEDALEARRRLFYVALTRARRRLTISYARANDEGKPLTQACFVDETGLTAAEAPVPEAALVEARAALLLDPPKPVIRLPESVRLDERLANLTLTVTALNRYLYCPLAFYYTDLLGIPESVREANAFGQAMHGALQQFFPKWKSARGKEEAGEQSLLRLFKQEMERRQGYFSEQTFEQRLALGREWLRRYYFEQVPEWRRRAVAERRVDRVTLDGIPLAGVIDKIEWLDDGTLRLVDYKTGAPDPKQVAAPDEQTSLGGNYWRQLAFYHILLGQAPFYPEPVRRLAIAWLEPDRRGRFVTAEFELSAGERAGMIDLIRGSWQRIQERKFTEGCGRPECAWCSLHRGEEPPALWEGVAGEGDLDDAAGGGRERMNKFM